MNFNKTILAGNLTSDPEAKEVDTGGLRKTVCNFTLAVNRRSRHNDEVLFMKCVAWGRTAEIARDYLKRGSSILVEGRLKQENWEKDGIRQSRISLQVSEVVFGDRNQQPEEPKEPVF